MPKPVREKAYKLVYTIEVETRGTNKRRRVAAIGSRIARFGWMTFGDRFSMKDHLGKEISFDPDAHDFGLGEA